MATETTKGMLAAQAIHSRGHGVQQAGRVQSTTGAARSAARTRAAFLMPVQCAVSGGRGAPTNSARRPADVRDRYLLILMSTRVIMRVLRHADQAVTMEIYAKASSEATRQALHRLGESLN